MIRFCDEEVFCVKSGELSRGERFTYFLTGIEKILFVCWMKMVNMREILLIFLY